MMLNKEEIENKSISKLFGTFYIDGHEFAIDASYIQEVVLFPSQFLKLFLSPNYLLGALNLRGNIISIVGLHKLLNFQAPEKLKNLRVVIINYNNEQIGITCDNTGEVLRIRNNEHNFLKYPDSSTIKIIHSAIKLNNGERIIQILNPFDLLKYENVPKFIDHKENADGNNEKVAKIRNLNSNMKKCISFKVRDYKFAFEITKIEEIVKSPEIEKTTFVDELCLGLITLRSRKIPVVDFSKYLGIKVLKDNISLDNTIIVMKVNGNIFGLLIDELDSIVSYWNENIAPVNSFSNRKENPFKGCIIRKEFDELLLFDQEKLFTEEEVSKISQGYSKMYHDHENDLKNKKNRKLSLYITFKSLHLFAINIGDIKEIINYHLTVSNPPGSPDFVEGVLNLRGEMITILNTKKMYDIKNDMNDDLNNLKIIIIFKNNLKVGLIADDIESIIQVDENDKTLLPNYLLKQSNDKLHHDVKEIIGISNNASDSIIILDTDSLSKRLKNEKVTVAEGN